MDQAEAKRWARATQLLDEVLQQPITERQSLVRRLGEEHGVSAELESLLTACETNSMLDQNLDDALRRLPETAIPHNAYRGQVLGNWTVGEEIGRGGMSIVCRASRTGQGFEQQAAVKILALANLGEDFIHGFLRERQILSDLDHPGIARLIDGGVTPDGAPYLVMQLVDGQRIDRWCETHNADTATITRLMVRLCQAVAYAQRHLVVHQDINPANVLVDAHGQPVLIDFGIARLLDQASGEGAEIRAFTPHFSAPEQRAGGTITTATDVYALGMLFRRLLGQRTIEQDLDLILEAATAADPEQRYANARNLLNDLQAWQQRRPIQARPPTLSYRFNRFLARNRWGVAAAALVMLSLLAGLGGALWQARIAEQERNLAQEESARALQVTEFLKDLFRASDPDLARGETVTARELLDQGSQMVQAEMIQAPELKADMLVLLGDLYLTLGESERADTLLQEGLALAESEGNPLLQVQALRYLAETHMESGNHEEGLALADKAEGILRNLGEIPGTLHASLMEPILFSLAEQGRAREAVQRGLAALQQARPATYLPPRALYDYIYSTANVMLIAEQLEQAELLLLEAEAIAEASPDRPTVQIALLTNLAGLFERTGQYEKTLDYRLQALALSRQIFPPDHPQLARALSNLSSTYNRMGEHDASIEALQEALSIYDEFYQGRSHPRVAAAINNLGQAFNIRGQYHEAEPLLVRARALAAELFGTNDPRYLTATGNLGDVYRRLGELDKSEQLLTENLDLRVALLGPEHPAAGSAELLLANLRLAQEQYEAALNLCDQALALFQRIDFQSVPILMAAQSRRARALAGLGRDDQAQAGFDRAFEQAGSAGSALGPPWLELLSTHAMFLASRQQPQAEAAIKQALAAHREILGPDHPETRQLEALAGEPLAD